MAFQNIPQKEFNITSSSGQSRPLFLQGQNGSFGTRSNGARSLSGAPAPNQHIDLLKDPNMNDKKMSSLLVPGSTSQGPVAVRSRGWGRPGAAVRPKLSLPNHINNSTSFMQLPIPYTLGVTLALCCPVSSRMTYGNWNQGSCRVGHRVYSHGQSWKDDCNMCSCNYGSVSCTQVYCPVYDCHVGNRVYSHGQTWKDECNTCSCYNGQASCTQVYCPPRCPTNPVCPADCGRIQYYTDSDGCRACRCGCHPLIPSSCRHGWK